MLSNLYIKVDNIGAFCVLINIQILSLHTRKSGEVPIHTTQMKKYFRVHVDILLSSSSQILLPKFKKAFKVMGLKTQLIK